jgi:hypothetical protein
VKEGRIKDQLRGIAIASHPYPLLISTPTLPANDFNPRQLVDKWFLI